MAFCALAFVVGSVFLIDLVHQEKRNRAKWAFYAYATIGFPAVVFLLHWIAVSGLSIYQIRQSFPYLPSDNTYGEGVVDSGVSVIEFIFTSATSSFSDLVIGVLFVAALVKFGFEAFRKPQENKNHIIALTSLAALYVMNMNEFLIEGAFYRTFWAKAVGIAMMFFLLYLTLRSASRRTRIVAYGIVLLFSINHANAMYAFSKINKTPARFLDVEKGQVYLGNEAAWMETVNQTYHYLDRNVSEGESFFALPYEPLFYFLLDQLSPTRQLTFFEYANIRPEQEESILGELNQSNVQYVVLSNRSKSRELGQRLGVFGKTYCPLIYQYVHENFEEVARFGSWKGQPGWAWNYGIKIFKRI
jgi:hypothetical protein